MVTLDIELKEESAPFAVVEVYNEDSRSIARACVDPRHPSDLELDVETGLYSVQVRTANGTFIQRSTRVVEDDDGLRIALSSKDVVTSWRQDSLLDQGGSEERDEESPLYEAALGELHRGQPASEPPPPGDHALLLDDGSGSWWSRLFRRGGKRASVTEEVDTPDETTKGDYEFRKTADRLPPSEPSLFDGLLHTGLPRFLVGKTTWSLTESGWRKSQAVDFPGSMRTGFQFVWGRPEGRAQSAIVMVHPEELDAELQATLSDDVVAISTGDRVQALLDFARLGDHESARLLAPDMIRTKYTARIPAAIAALYLAGAEFARDIPDDWWENLHQISDLPDGAVANGWRLWNERQDEKRAYEAFLTAACRGVPYLSRGLRMLIDGLSLFETDDAAKAAHRLEPFADAMIWSTPRTTFWGVSPDQPGYDLDAFKVLSHSELVPYRGSAISVGIEDASPAGE